MSTLNARVLFLSLSYNFVTKFTSLIVVQNDDLNNTKLEDEIIDLLLVLSKEFLDLSAVSVEPSEPPTRIGRVRVSDGHGRSSPPISRLNKLLTAAILIFHATVMLLS